MEEKKITSHVVKGLITSLILIVLGIAGYFSGLYKESWFSWSTYVVELVAIIIGCISYANQKDGFVTFGNVFAHGFKMSVVIALILIVWFLLSITVIFPEMKDKIFDMARQRMEDNGKMSESQIDQAMEMTRKFFIPFAIAGTLIGTLICGAIASLIGAAVAKKKPLNPLDQMSM